jgi:dephospho-CoA kinase
MTKIVGLTGGIGSGKTTIANYFQSLGIPVYIADTEAKKITELPETIIKIRREFGNAVFENDKLLRDKLAMLVFNNTVQLQRLNSIIHPAVKEHFAKWLLQHKKSPIVIKEAAILFESGSYKDCDSIITVVSPLDSRIDRVMKRDQSTSEEVLTRINNQWSDEMRISKSDYIIENTDIKQAKLAADKILKKLLIQ